MSEALNAELGKSGREKPDRYPFRDIMEMGFRLDDCFDSEDSEASFKKVHRLISEDLPLIIQYLKKAPPSEANHVFSAILGSSFFRGDDNPNREIYSFLCSVIEKNLVNAERVILEGHDGPYWAMAVLAKFGNQEQRKKTVELWEKLLWEKTTQEEGKSVSLSDEEDDLIRTFLSTFKKEEKDSVIKKWLEYFRKNGSWKPFGDGLGRFFDFFNPGQKKETLEIFLRNYCGGLKLTPDEFRSLPALLEGNSVVSSLEEGIFPESPPDEKFRPHFPQEGSLAWKVYKAIIEGFGLNYSEMVNGMSSTEINGLNKLKEISSNSAEMLKSNFRQMCLLEMQEPGICRFLHQEFGIKHFSRYPLPVLLAQYQERENTQKAYGVIIYPDSDWNSAFNSNRERGIIATFHLDLSDCGYLLRICEVRNLGKLGRRLLELDKKYGDFQKISFAIIGGHGTKERVRFGGDKSGYSREGLAEGLTRFTLEKERANRAKNFFIPQPTIILQACSSDELGAIMAKMGGIVFSYKEPGSISSIRARKKPGGILEFDVKAESKKGEDITAYLGPGKE